MSATMPQGYYDRFASDKGWERVLFRASRYFQSAEINEVQQIFSDRVTRIASAIFKDGDIVRNGGVTVNPDTGAVRLEAGSIYVQGGIREVPLAAFVIQNNVTEKLGIRVHETVLTELEDTSLRDIAQGTRGYGEPGAARLVRTYRWGFGSDVTTTDDFFPVYTVQDGVVIATAPPPQLDAVTEALARYDRDANGNYIVSGHRVSALGLSGGYQNFTIQEGVANVLGYKLERQTSSRLRYVEDPDIQTVTAEPHVYNDPQATGTYNVDVFHFPIAELTSVTVTAEKTVNINHGGYIGVSDPLPDTSIVSIQSVKQGGTTYSLNNDYKLTADQVDWSPNGAEPSTTSTYTVTYRYLKTVPGNQLVANSKTITVPGGVNGTTMLLNYKWKLPRIDAITLDRNGVIALYKGVSSAYTPQKPRIPSTLLLLAYVANSWGANPEIGMDDTTRAIRMSDLESMSTMIGNLFDLVAQEQLLRDVTASAPVAKRGVFVDPFTNDNLRDQGLPQTASIYGGELTLSVLAGVRDLPDPATQPGSTVPGTGTSPGGWQLGYSIVTKIEQPFATGSMKINPYQAFDAIPASLLLSPNVDAWVEYQTQYLSAATQQIWVWLGPNTLNAPLNLAQFGAVQFAVASVSAIDSDTVDNIVGTKNVSLGANMRSRDVNFTITGFEPGEKLTSLTFDGITVGAVVP